MASIYGLWFLEPQDIGAAVTAGEGGTGSPVPLRWGNPLVSGAFRVPGASGQSQALLSLYLWLKTTSISSDPPTFRYTDAWTSQASWCACVGNLLLGSGYPVYNLELKGRQGRIELTAFCMYQHLVADPSYSPWMGLLWIPFLTALTRYKNWQVSGFPW